MHLSILFSVLALATALPTQGSYSAPRRQEPLRLEFSDEVGLGGRQDLSGFQRIGSFEDGRLELSFEDSRESFGIRGQINEHPCRDNEIRHIDGSCVEPIINQNLYLFHVPEQERRQYPAPILPTPRINHNIVFVRVPDSGEDQDPIVIPPPQEKTVVYVLKDDDQSGEQRVIEVPSGPAHQPEVIYVNYEEGSNPELPIGVDLQTALASLDAREAIVLDTESLGRGGSGGGSRGGSRSGSRGGGLRTFIDYDDSFEIDSRERFNLNRNSGSSSRSSSLGGSRKQQPSRSYGTP